MKIIKIVTLLIASLVIGYCLNIYTFPLIVKEADGFNEIAIKFSFLSKSGILGIKSFDENGLLAIDQKKTISVEQTKIKKDHGYVRGLTVYTYEILVPVKDSHRTIFEFHGEDNILFINDIKVNNKSINLDNFFNNIISNSYYNYGTIDSIPGYFFKFSNDEIAIDVTKALNLVHITNDEKEKLDQEYKELNILITFFVIIATFLINYLIFICLRNVGTSKIENVYLLLISLISLIILINTSYYQLLENALRVLNSNIDDNFRNNFNIFELNFLPLITIIPFCIIISFLINKKILKNIGIVPAAVIALIIFTDNCILNVLGIRLNFKMGDNYANEFKYFLDFLIKYINSESGILMSLGLLLCVLLSVSSFLFRFNIVQKKVISVSLLPLGVIIALGLLPPNSPSNDFKLANPFQINGWSFSKIGNFNAVYSEDYSQRKNLNLKWISKSGLNNRRNIIILIVESWGCNFTYICGKGPSYMPKIEKLVHRGLFFDNYYSIIPSTSLSYTSIVKSVPVIQSAFKINDSNDHAGDLSYKSHPLVFVDRLYSENDLINAFHNNNYKTSFISSGDLVFGLDKALQLSPYDEIIDAKNLVFDNIKERGVFNSVNDEQLFDYIISKIKTEKSNFLYVTATLNNHSPYNSPLGFNNMNKAFEYTDNAIYNFVTELKDLGYFEHGILVLTGDHHAWGDTNISDPVSPNFINKVPLIIIDDKSHENVNHHEFSHASLGVLLQYLELPEYKMNKFNVNPLQDDDSELIFGYDYDRISYITIKKDERRATIVLDGDDSEFLEKDAFSDDEMNDILGYIATFRR